MVFFSKWYDIQSPEKKRSVKKLIQNGQLEIINGGWVAGDEADPNYEDMINNMMIGHQFLEKEFGVKPTIGWDIDTFGHSDTNNRLFSELGFDAMFFSRLDWDEKNDRNQKRALTYL